jgi:hypothetical protein
VLLLDFRVWREIIEENLMIIQISQKVAAVFAEFDVLV